MRFTGKLVESRSTEIFAENVRLPLHHEVQDKCVWKKDP